MSQFYIENSGGGGSIVTIDGDTGSITGSTVTIFANNAALNCGSSVEFVNSGTTSTLNVSDATVNTIVGSGSGNLGSTGNNNAIFGCNSFQASGSSSYNVGVGYGVLGTATAVVNSVAIGLVSMNNASSNRDCTAVGFGTLYASQHDIENTAIGSNCMNVLNGSSSGNGNCGLGYNSLVNMTHGARNLVMGSNSGSAYVSVSDNILLNSAGVNTDVNTLRIGNATGSGSYQLNKAFISGINGVTLGGTPKMVVIDSTTDQLGVVAIPTGGITTLDGDSGSATGTTVTLYADNAALTCGSTVKFVNSGSTSTLNVTDATVNTIVGSGSGNLGSTGNNNAIFGCNSFQASGSSSYNVGVGYGVLGTATAVINSVAIGLVSMNNASNNSDCTAVGFGTLYSSQHDIQNTAIGSNCMNVLNGSSTGNGNCGLGYNSLVNMTHGARNLVIGSNSGSAYVSVSDNILLNSAGVSTDAHVLRIGSATGTGNYQLSTSYISGIAGATLSAGSPTPYLALVDTSNDQVVCPTPVQASAATSTFGSMAVGTPLQNTANYPILVNLSVVVTAAGSSVISIGVGPTNTPTAQAVTAAFSTAGTFDFSFVVPSKFYAEITTSGFVTTIGSITTFVSQIG